MLLGVAPFRSAPLGVLRPKRHSEVALAWSPIWFFFCWQASLGGAGQYNTHALKLALQAIHSKLVATAVHVTFWNVLTCMTNHPLPVAI
jgi:hypothetical protein